MPNITGHTELVGLMAYPIRHTQSPTTHNLAYDKNGDDVIQLAFEVDNDTLEDTVKGFKEILEGKYDDLPEQAFHNVGTIEEAVKKAETLSE